MFVEGGRKPEPLPSRTSLTPRQERVMLWLLTVGALLLILAPIGGATIARAASRPDASLIVVTRGHAECGVTAQRNHQRTIKARALW